MKRIIIKIEVDLPAEERAMLEAKFRKEYESGLMIIPHFCSALVVDEVEFPSFTRRQDE